MGFRPRASQVEGPRCGRASAGRQRSMSLPPPAFDVSAQVGGRRVPWTQKGCYSFPGHGTELYLNHQDGAISVAE